MSADTVVRARIDPSLKQQAEEILAAKGLTISEALRQMMMHVVRNGSLPFELITQHQNPRIRIMDHMITPQMRNHSTVKTINYFGFRGNRAAISLLYARVEGASQVEVNDAGRALGSPTKNYLNMLHQAIEWGHEVFVWDDADRGGKVYKLLYNPKHGAPRAVDPPANWRTMNEMPRGVSPTPYHPHRS